MAGVASHDVAPTGEPFPNPELEAEEAKQQ